MQSLGEKHQPRTQRQNWLCTLRDSRRLENKTTEKQISKATQLFFLRSSHVIRENIYD